MIHLHVHTHYSLLESTVKIPDLISKAKSFGHAAVAMTDHGNMFGAVDFYLAAKAQGLKPLLGCEVYYTLGSRLNKATRGGKRVAQTPQEIENSKIYRLVLLCKNSEGYQNLCELVTRGFTEGFEFRPRVDREILKQYSVGLIALTSGLKGELGVHVLQGNLDRAESAASWLREVYKDDLYLELQENRLPEQTKLNSWIYDFSKKNGLPTVATSDVHYLEKDQGPAHEVLLCIGAGRNLDESRASRLCTDEFWFKDEATMEAQFHWNLEALKNTELVAEKINFSFKLKDEKGRQIYHLPDFRPEGWETSQLNEFSAEEFLRKKAREGLQERLKDSERGVYEARLSEELEMIIRTGFAGYFLVVADFIGYAKSIAVPVGPGRGSGAGSLVAYALKITDIDPIPFNLLFERFINPERISLPDFDVDFCQDRRQEVIDYVVRKYGRSNVSQIITFGKLLARGVIRDVGRVLGLTYGEVDILAKLIPEELGITLEDAFEKEPKLLELCDRDPKVNRLFEIARSLEGLNRHASVHAAGVVITNKPLVEYCPLYMGKEGESVVQYDKDYAEKIGLVKFDFLGLKTLTVIDNAVKFIRETQAEQGVAESDRFLLSKIKFDDKNVYALVTSGDTDGVFQLESSGMKDLCKRVQPSTLEDLTAINALYRPGPLNSGMVDDFINRKHGKTPVVYELPQLAEILEETYGVIVYQEQVMRVARVLANYSLGEADILRRAMGKKKPEEMANQRDKFIAGCKANGIAEEKAQRLFDLLAKFAEYGFNKSHSAAYAVLSYQTAYLKKYFPAQFMAALMATEMENTDKMAQYIADAKTHGIAILPPDVNASKKTFSVVSSGNTTSIRFGLEAIKGVGGVAVDVILAERNSKGGFKNFVDFCTRVSQRKVNKKVLESLIGTGAFDSIAEENRATLFESIESVTDYTAKVQEQADLGQVSIFDQYQAEGLKLEINTAHLFRRLPDWPESKKLQTERGLVGFYVSGHPMDKWAVLIKNFTHGDLTWVREEFSARKLRGSNLVRWEVTTAGLVTNVKEIMTKKGSRMAFVEVEDNRAKLECVCFPEAFEQYGTLIRLSNADCIPLILSGGISLEEEVPKLLVRAIDSVTDYQQKRINSVVLRLDPTKVDVHKLAQLRAVLVKHQGKCSTYIEYVGTLSGVQLQGRFALPKELAVAASSEMIAEVNALFHSEVVRLG